MLIFNSSTSFWGILSYRLASIIHTTLKWARSLKDERPESDFKDVYSYHRGRRESIKILEAERLCPQANAVHSAAGCHTLIASTPL